jgi:hypothetical protein
MAFFGRPLMLQLAFVRIKKASCPVIGRMPFSFRITQFREISADGRKFVVPFNSFLNFDEKLGG